MLPHLAKTKHMARTGHMWEPKTADVYGSVESPGPNRSADSATLPATDQACHRGNGRRDDRRDDRGSECQS